MRFPRVLLAGGCLSLLAVSLPAKPAPAPSEVEFAGEDYVVLREARKVRFENDGTGQIETTTRVRLLTDTAVRQWGLLTMPYDAGSQSLDLKDVRVERSSGEVFTPSLAQL